MKLRTIALWMLAFGTCASLAAQPARTRAQTVTELEECHKLREVARRALILARKPAELLTVPLASLVQFDSRHMTVLARVAGMRYDPSWDRDPAGFYKALVARYDERCLSLALQVASSRAFESPDPLLSQGAIEVPRDFKNRPIITDGIIDRYIRVKFAETQSGVAPRRAGYFTQFDYDDVGKRIEWARDVKRSQGGDQLVSTSAVREQFSDDEVRVLNRRWRDLDNAQNGRWDELQSVVTGRS